MESHSDTSRPSSRPGAVPGVAVLLAAVLSGAVQASTGDGMTLPGEAEVRCVAEADGLACRYRLLPPGQVVGSITASVDGMPLAVSEPEPYPHPGSRSTILFLLDAGPEGEDGLLAHKRQQLEAILARAAPHQRFGLATIDNELEVLELPVNDADDVIQALKRVRPSVKPTELYRTTLVAVRLLAKQPMDRKGIVIVSDGQAEDTAYFARDVIAAARDGGVVITSLGFAPSSDAAPALQSLRRLSEETGGEFAAADADGHLPAGFLEAPFRSVDNGGRFTIAAPPGRRAAGSVEIRIATGGREYTADTPAVLPRRSPPPAEPVPAPPARRQVERFSADEGPSVLDFALLGGLLALFAIVAFVLVRRIRGGQASPDKPLPKATPAPPAARNDSHGVLEFVHEPGRGAMVLAGESLRIGRQGDNDLRLEDNSVSRHHAQIHRGPDGAYVISDLNSLNGIYVNGRQVQSSQLKDGDKVEVGDVSLRFRLVAGPAPEPGDDFGETVVSRHPGA